ncbi:hypothetical protein EV421DRAFT_2025153 [Armillaria borealis]|uniref:Uncharacterized protein n=1 Tax=Armillaria borealis TaxID=47425 RepID=A0AA39IVB4_9AGAR|nr:hypothetical protein EV421DRAFT_2025153 [Armillaria borealis]
MGFHRGAHPSSRSQRLDPRFIFSFFCSLTQGILGTHKSNYHALEGPSLFQSPAIIEERRIEDVHDLHHRIPCDITCSRPMGILGSWLHLHMVSKLQRLTSRPISEALVLPMENLLTHVGFLEGGGSLLVIIAISQ